MDTKYLVLIALLIHPGLAAAQSTPPPYNPSGLVLAPTADGTGTLVSWRRGSPASATFVRYQVQRRRSISFEDVGPPITDPTITTYIISHEDAGTVANFAYSHQVQEVYTVDGQEHTGTSNIVNWIYFTEVTDGVDNLQGAVLDGAQRGQVQLTWEQPTTAMPITGYSIFFSGGTDVTDVNTRSYTITSPMPGIYNQYRVRAVFPGSTGGGSLISVLTPPAIPTDVEIVLGADGEFTLNWEPPIGTTEYKIERGSVTPSVTP